MLYGPCGAELVLLFDRGRAAPHDAVREPGPDRKRRRGQQDHKSQDANRWSVKGQGAPACSNDGADDGEQVQLLLSHASNGNHRASYVNALLHGAVMKSATRSARARTAGSARASAVHEADRLPSPEP